MGFPCVLSLLVMAGYRAVRLALQGVTQVRAGSHATNLWLGLRIIAVQAATVWSGVVVTECQTGSVRLVNDCQTSLAALFALAVQANIA